MQKNYNDDEQMNRQWISRLVQNANMGLWKKELRTLVQENLEMVWTVSPAILILFLLFLQFLDCPITLACPFDEHQHFVDGFYCPSRFSTWIWLRITQFPHRMHCLPHRCLLSSGQQH